MTNEELKKYLIEEAEYSESKVEEMTEWELVNAWLTWEGIIGYTTEIIENIFNVYGIKREI